MSVLIFLALVIMAIVQFIIYKRKQAKFNFSESQAKIQELLTALGAGKQKYTDQAGRTILMIACSESNETRKGELSFFDVIKKSVETGIRVNAKSLKDGQTALAYAAAQPYNSDVVAYLLKVGSDVSAKDHNGRTPLFAAVESSDMTTYTSIVDRAPKVDQTDNRGFTPLMVASKNMCIPVIRDLLDRGADAKLTNKQGENVYDIAEKHKYEHIKRGGNSAHPDQYGEHNHGIKEIVRELNCIVNDKRFKPQKYVAPIRESGEDVGD